MFNVVIEGCTYTCIRPQTKVRHVDLGLGVRISVVSYIFVCHPRSSASRLQADFLRVLSSLQQIEVWQSVFRPISPQCATPNLWMFLQWVLYCLFRFNVQVVVVVGEGLKYDLCQARE